MKILKIGSFNGNGNPIGWSFDLESPPNLNAHCLSIRGDFNQDCPVTVNGIEIVEWTDARRAAMVAASNPFDVA